MTTVEDNRKSLRADGIAVHFGELRALDGVSLTVGIGEIVGLIGPNGSGKTTLINVLTGFQRATSGRVTLRGTEVTHLAPAQRGSAGMARTFQGVRLFGRLTVQQNVEVAALAAGGRRSAARERTSALLERLELRDVADRPAGQLPYGVERRVSIARALALQPSFLLLDEPAAGLDERETDALAAILHEVRADFSCGLLVIEHDLRLIAEICQRVQVLSAGRTIASGRPDEILSDPTVSEAYLGRPEVVLSA